MHIESRYIFLALEIALDSVVAENNPFNSATSRRFYRITVTIRTEDETATAGRHRAYAWQPHNCLLCKIHTYHYYGRAYINPHTYISARSARDSSA